MKNIFTLMLLCTINAIVFAQSSLATQQEEMKKMSFLVGNWEGEGWIVTPDGKRHTFKQTERIQNKLNGLAILIEGEGKEDGRTFFQSMVVLNYDEYNKRYRFLTHTTQGPFADAEAKVIDGGMEWGFQIPGGRTRYTIKVNDKHEWFEIGEFSSDEKNWRKFMELMLKKTN